MTGLTPSRSAVALTAAVILNSAVVGALCLPHTERRPPPPSESVVIRLANPPKPPPVFPDPATPPKFSEPPPSPASKPALPAVIPRPAPLLTATPRPILKPTPPREYAMALAPRRPAAISPPKLQPQAITVAALPNHPTPPPMPPAAPTPETSGERNTTSSLSELASQAQLFGGRTPTQPLSSEPLAPATSGVVNLGSEMPTPLHRVNPDYPAAALRLGLEGYVDVRFVIAPDGSVADVKIADSSSSRFHDATLEAIRQWRFEPIIRQGVAVTAFCMKRFSFEQRR